MYNKSRTYILPLIWEPFNDLNKLYLRNTYLFKNKLSSDTTLSVAILSAQGRTPEYVSFEEKLTNHKSCEAVEPYFEGALVTFNIPEDRLEDYLLIIQGKYSRISGTSKRLILQFWSEYHKNTDFFKQLKSVLNRDPLLRKQLESDLAVTINPEQDLSSIIDLETEIYT